MSDTIRDAAAVSDSVRVIERKLDALLLPTISRQWVAVVKGTDVTAVVFRSVLHHVVMLLIDADEALAGRNAPPGLSGSELHAWVWNDRTAALWNDGHLGAALSTAATRIEEELAAKLGTDLTGTKLAGQAFTIDDPRPGQRRLRLRDSGRKGSPRWTSAHQGAMHLGMGIAGHIRNRFAHDSGTTADAPPLDDLDALHYLVTLSTYARLIDNATVHPQPRSRTPR